MSYFGKIFVKRLFLSCILISLFLQPSFARQKFKGFDLIPYPNSVVLPKGRIKYFASNTHLIKVYEDFGKKEIPQNIRRISNFDYLKESLEIFRGTKLFYTNEEYADIILKYTKTKSKDESYTLKITKEKIIIEGSPVGVFRGIQTLIQIFNQFFEEKSRSVAIPLVEIKDKPYFKYRGIHLDVVRHFFTVSEVKKVINTIAKYKINNLHLHLSDDQGWRVEIKKYPKLTQIGSKRKETILNKNSSPYVGDNKPYGGFYTQQDIKELVKYAKKRNINIIPEINMPEHTLAMLASYPSLGCVNKNYEVGTHWGNYPEVLCAGKEEVYTFVKNVLDEIIELFPSEYIHIGGKNNNQDFSTWRKCIHCQSFMKRNKIKSNKKLYHYFIKQLEKYVESKKRKIIGWDEIFDDNISSNSVIMSWRGDLSIARKKRGVILCPNNFYYFNHYQSLNEKTPLAFGGLTDIKQVYEYTPIPANFGKKNRQYIMGVQANVWTEYIETLDYLEYMLFPRLFALAETGWLSPTKKSYEDFSKRIAKNLNLLEKLKVNYSKSFFEVKIDILPYHFQKVKVDMNTNHKRGEIRYTLDGTIPTLTSKLFKKPFELDKRTEIVAQYFIDDKPIGFESSSILNFHKAVGAKVQLKSLPDPQYNPDSPQNLVNGIFGNPQYNNGEWYGFREEDFEAVVEFAKPIQTRLFGINFLVNSKAGILPPKVILFYYSKDGIEYELITQKLIKQDRKDGIVNFRIEFNKEIKYLKVKAETMGTIPNNLPEAGHKVWLLIDEIIIE